MNKRIIYNIIFFLTAHFLSAQSLPEKGVPFIQNYFPGDYHHNGKVWDIKTAMNGLQYMASDKGLIEFDGRKWNVFKGSVGFTRSVLPISDSIIYTGSDLDFGVWKRNKYQDFEYRSLYPFKEALSDQYEEFWDVYKINETILFVSAQNLYVYASNQLTKIPAPTKFSGSWLVQDTLYLSDEFNGLYIFRGTTLNRLVENPGLIDMQVVGAYPSNGGIVFVTKKSGLYFYSSGALSLIDNALSRQLMKAKVFSFESINGQNLAFGTILNGLLITDRDGRIVHRINKQKGLPNNTVLNLHYNPSGKLWVSMDYGISVLALRNNLTYIFDYRGDFGTGYSAVLSDQKFYLGTNQGLYTSSWQNLNNDSEFYSFSLVPGSEGQVWCLKKIGNAVLIGHDKGLFTLKGSTIFKIGEHEGVWTIVPYGNYLLAGNYNGISIFRKNGESWDFVKKMEYIYGSCNQLEIENNNVLWINIPNYGLIRAELDDNLVPSNRQIFRDSIFEGDNPILKVSGGVVLLATDRYEYEFDPKSLKFINMMELKSNYFNNHLLAKPSVNLFINEEYTFYPVYNGFGLKSNIFKEIPGHKSYPLLVRNIEAFNNYEKRKITNGESLAYALNNISFEAVLPGVEDVFYQYRLNKSKSWSTPASDNSIEIINLKIGQNNIEVRTVSEGKISDSVVLTVYVIAPWYRSVYAYLAYALIIIFVSYIFNRRHINALRKQKLKLLKKEQSSLRKIKEKHRQKELLFEQQQLQVEYDQIKQQLKDKTIELANKAKDNEDKNRLLLSVREKMDEIQLQPEKSKTKWAELERMLDSYIKVEDNTFEIQMDELHQDFFKKLRDSYPGLSGYDLRLCAYLKIGMNSKEIADILNVQPSSAYISRSRLRKKLNLNVDEDLYTFLNNL